MGMGHLFRMINLRHALQQKGAETKFVLVDSDEAASQWLTKREISHEFVETNDPGWEKRIVEIYHPHCWVNDRLATEEQHVLCLKASGLTVMTFDDSGAGAALSDLNVFALAEARGETPKGKRVLQGLEYLIMPPEISNYRRQREKAEKIVVSLGGSDTYGMTVKVATWLAEHQLKATIVLGPGFIHDNALQTVMTDDMRIERSPVSLIHVLSTHDVAITGGGLTAFEAAAMGLPTFTIANELHEICHCEYLQSLGCSRYLGYREQASMKRYEYSSDIVQMSEAGLQIKLRAEEKISDILLKYKF